MDKHKGEPPATRCLRMMVKPTVKSVLRFYTAVTGKEPPPEVAAKIRASFEEPGAQSERKPDDAPTDDRGLIARREGRA
jgi:hypothetical protein